MPRAPALALAAAAALVLATALGVGAGPAAGQGATSALKNHDSNAPVDVDADRLEVQDRADRAVFSGNVRIVQGDLTMTAARVNVAYSGGADGTQIQRLDASGGVRLVSPSEAARGDYAIYDLDRRLITLIGGVVLDRAGSQLRGGRLLIDLASGRATVDGNAVGGGTTGVPGSGGGGRVSGHFTVRQKPQGSGGTTTP